MDPLSVLSVTSAVVQLIDFTGKLVGGTYRIYKAGTGDTPKTSELKSITNNLITLNRGVEKSLISKKGTGLGSQNEHDLYNLCMDCNQVAQELITALQKLQGQRTNVWDSFRHALLTIWTTDNVNSLQERVGNFKQQISMHILVSLREQMTSLTHRESVRDEQISRSLRKFQSRNDQFLRDLDRSMKWQGELINAIYRSHAQKPSNAQLGKEPENSKYLDHGEMKFFKEIILKDLGFGELEDRHDRITEAHEKTFRWIYEEPRTRKTWASFPRWMQNDDDQLYWITGKAGAGKSTLMKYIYDEPKTTQLLLRWAGGKPLIRTSFFFWNSGTSLQMSQEGLLRTLLHGILIQCPNLVPIIFPDRLEAFILLPLQTRLPWTWNELLRGFRVLLAELSKTQKLALFIDGLDEFEGDHTELISLIRSIQNRNIKICVASRPWIVFQDAFKHEPNLTLEELTSSDILEFVKSGLSRNPGFWALQVAEPTYAKQLIRNVAVKASGVFLWVFLVLRSLLDGLSSGERLSDLQARLESLPGDIEMLFWKIIHQLDEAHFKRGIQLFQLVREAIVPLTVLELSYADEDSTEFTFATSIGVINNDQKAARAELMRRRLNVCTKGLLEATPATALQSQKPGLWGGYKQASNLLGEESLVGYLHRTVRDFMMRHDTWISVRAAIKEPYNPNFQLCSSYIVQLKTLQASHNLAISWKFWDMVTYGIEYAVRADPTAEHMQFRLLEELDRVANMHLTDLCLPVGSAQNQAQGPPLAHKSVTSKIKHWAATSPDFRFCKSFLQFATQCQLVDYVKAQLEKDSKLCTIQDPHPLLYLAIHNCKVLGNSTDRPVCSHSTPSVELVNLLLQHGADPEYKVNGETIKRFVEERAVRGNETSWLEISDLFKNRSVGRRISSRFSRMLKVF